ncbi:MAG: putative dsRNA-binding protein [Candidatus Gastranaerophilaceae bacterium]
MKNIMQKHFFRNTQQSLNKEIPVYTLVNQSGPDHNKVFVVEVSYNNRVLASGEGKSKKEAEQHAAYEACKILGVAGCQKQ